MRPRRSVLRRTAASILCCTFASPLAADETEPFRTRNLSPLISIFGHPGWETGITGTRFGLTSEVANHYRLSRRGDELLILDGETWRTSLSFRHAFGGGWVVGAELPYYQQTGGFLDDVIDGWHAAFGLPDGGRNRRAENQLEFLLADESGAFFSLDQRARGLGDAQVSLGRRVGVDGKYFIEATLKLPTGDEDLLAGSGSADASVTLLRSRSLTLADRPAAFMWGVGALALGDAPRIEFEARQGAVLGMLGGSIRPWPRVGFKGQIDFHSALYDSPLEEIGDPGVQATVGGWWDMSDRGALEIAVNEDLAVSTSPDVVFYVAIHWSL